MDICTVWVCVQLSTGSGLAANPLARTTESLVTTTGSAFRLPYVAWLPALSHSSSLETVHVPAAAPAGIVTAIWHAALLSSKAVAVPQDPIWSSAEYAWLKTYVRQSDG